MRREGLSRHGTVEKGLKRVKGEVAKVLKVTNASSSTTRVI